MNNQQNEQQQIDPIQLSNQVIGNITKQLGVLGNVIEQLVNQMSQMQQYIQTNIPQQVKFTEPSSFQ